jgi:hypothetical protein
MTSGGSHRRVEPMDPADACGIAPVPAKEMARES